VRRPNSSASVVAMPSPMVPPITSGSKNGLDQPPWRNPPSVSSSTPPGACTTPSMLMNSVSTILIVGTTMVGGRIHRKRRMRSAVSEQCPLERVGEPALVLGLSPAELVAQHPAHVGAGKGPDRLPGALGAHPQRATSGDPAGVGLHVLHAEAIHLGEHARHLGLDGRCRAQDLEDRPQPRR